MARPQRHEPDEAEDDRRTGAMGFLDHLEELRRRIIRSCVAIAAGMTVSYWFKDRIAEIVMAPTLAMLPKGTTLIYTRPGEGFSFYLDVSLIGGLVLASPIVAYQVWRFIAPGLYANEKKFVVPFVALSSLGAVAGAAFCHHVLFPATIAFFGSFDSALMRMAPRVEDVFDLYKGMLLAMIVVFQIPTLAFFAARMELVTAGFLWRNFGYAILIVFIVAAALTPSTDPWNQAVFAAPMLALYLVSIAIVWAARPARPRADRRGSTHLKLVFAAGVIEHAQRRRHMRRRRLS